MKYLINININIYIYLFLKLLVKRSYVTEKYNDHFFVFVNFFYQDFMMMKIT